uniref:SET domain-containing protein n=1 Tax=Panagrellus redivivus TaxID=6233 RepID=A0A7E4UYH6_PANRE
MTTSAFSDSLKHLEGVLDPRVIFALSSIPAEKRPDISVLQYFVQKSVPFRLNVKTGQIAVDTEGKGLTIQRPKAVAKQGRKQRAGENLHVAKQSQPPSLRGKRSQRQNLSVPILSGVSSKGVNRELIADSSTLSVDSPIAASKLRHSGASSTDAAVSNPRGKRGRKRKSPLTVDTDQAGQVETSPTSDTPSTGTRRPHVSTLSPKRYNPKVRKAVPEPPSVDSKGNPLRRSERCVAKRANAESDKDSKDVSYDDLAAIVPKMVDPATLDNAEERDVLLIDPEDTQAIDDKLVKGYMEACRDKLGVCSYSAFLHYVNHGYDIKKAMETIDDPHSLPRMALEGNDGVGIWDKEEIAYLTHQLNSKRTPKSILRMKKNLPNKKYSNCIQAYYDLKRFRCTNGRKNFCCPIKVNARYDGYTVKSADCANCKDGLWKEDSQDYPKDIQLCALCRFYREQYQTMRPNAQITPLKFDFTDLECKCNAVPEPIDENKELGEILLNICKADRRELAMIKGDKLSKFIEYVTKNKLSVGSTFEKYVRDSTIIDENQTYIVVTRIGSVNLRSYTDSETDVSTEADVPTSSTEPLEDPDIEIARFQELIQEMKPGFLNLLSMVPKEKRTVPYLISLYCGHSNISLDDELLQLLFEHLLAEFSELSKGECEILTVNASEASSNNVVDSDVEVLPVDEAHDIPLEISLNASSIDDVEMVDEEQHLPLDEDHSIAVNEETMSETPVDLVKSELHSDGEDAYLECAQQDDGEHDIESVNVKSTRIMSEPPAAITGMSITREPRAKSVGDEVDSVQTTSIVEQEHHSNDDDEYMDCEEQDNNVHFSEGDNVQLVRFKSEPPSAVVETPLIVRAKSVGDEIDFTGAIISQDAVEQTVHSDIQGQEQLLTPEDVKAPRISQPMSAKPKIDPRKDTFRDTYPDIMFFGTMNSSNELTADFDVDFRNFYTSMVANMELEAVPCDNVPEDTSTVKPYEGGLNKFLLTYLDNKKNMKVTAEVLGTTIPALKALVDQNHWCMDIQYSIIEQALKEAKRNRKRPDPNFFDPASEPPQKLSRSARRSHARGAKGGS